MDKSFLKYAPTFMYQLWNLNVLSEQFIMDFAEKKIKLDKDSGLREKKLEKKFLEAIVPFIEWLGTTKEEEDEFEEVDDKEEEAASPEAKQADDESKEAIANLEAEK